MHRVNHTEVRADAEDFPQSYFLRFVESLLHNEYCHKPSPAITPHDPTFIRQLHQKEELFLFAVNKGAYTSICTLRKDNSITHPLDIRSIAGAERPQNPMTRACLMWTIS